jgi:signal transduction histidine kinase
MLRNPIKSRELLSFLASFLLLASVFGRSIPRYSGTPYLGWLIGLLAAFILLFATEWWISKRFPRYRPFYFILQFLIILFLLLYLPPFDYFAVLFIPLTGQAFWFLPYRSALRLTIAFAIASAVSMVDGFGWMEGLSFALTYTAVLSFVVIICLTTLRAEQAQAESQALLKELGDAHRELQAYAEKVEELASAQERNRLARELHDSVTQTIFSMTLTAQAARILLDRDPSRLAGQLDRLQSLAQNALAEMRTLIQQLRPHSIVEGGLAAALRAHASERQAKDGLSVDLQISGDRRLPLETEEVLFRVVQEALNNVVKHARTSQAAVTLDLQNDPVTLTIEDHGAGFDPAMVKKQEAGVDRTAHMGLAGMAERIQSIGGKLVIDSKPGTGTRIRVENIRVEEQQHA